MNLQLQQALQILKQKRDQLMGNIDQMGQQMMTPQGRQEGMDLAMKMVTGGMTMPKTSLANEALYGQRDKIARLLNPKNLGYIRRSNKRRKYNTRLVFPFKYSETYRKRKRYSRES